MTINSKPLAINDLALLLPGWRTHLASRNVAPSTIASYLKVADNLLVWLAAHDRSTELATIDRRVLEGFLAELTERVSAATVAKHYRSLQQLFRFLVEDDELPASPMERMRPPKVPLQPVEVFTDDELRALLAVAKGNTFEQRRDTALLRFFIDTGCRVAEVCGLRLDDVDQERREVLVMGKGRKMRGVPYGLKTADALRRYLRVRSTHPFHAAPAFWLGRKGALTTSGLAQLLERRATDAGVTDVHPHRFRHTFAHTWLANGGQEHDLMRLAGWDSPQMVARYAASAGAERARDNFRKAALGDRL